VLWSGLISFINVLGEIPNGLIAAANGACMLMSDLTHRSLACKAHLNMLYALYKFITITIDANNLYDWAMSRSLPNVISNGKR